MYKLGLASQLKTFPDNEIKAGQLATRINALAKLSDEIQWPKRSNDLPVLTWDQCEALGRATITARDADVSLNPLQSKRKLRSASSSSFPDSFMTCPASLMSTPEAAL